jgi:hypothetical protein
MSVETQPVATKRENSERHTAERHSSKYAADVENGGNNIAASRLVRHLLLDMYPDVHPLGRTMISVDCPRASFSQLRRFVRSSVKLFPLTILGKHAAC